MNRSTDARDDLPPAMRVAVAHVPPRLPRRAAAAGAVARPGAADDAARRAAGAVAEVPGRRRRCTISGGAGDRLPASVWRCRSRRPGTCRCCRNACSAASATASRSRSKSTSPTCRRRCRRSSTTSDPSTSTAWRCCAIRSSPSTTCSCRCSRPSAGCSGLAITAALLGVDPPGAGAADAVRPARRSGSSTWRPGVERRSRGIGRSPTPAWPGTCSCSARPRHLPRRCASPTPATG